MSIHSISNNDQHIRLKIYEGDIPKDDYHQDMLRIVKGQKDAEIRRLKDHIKFLKKALEKGTKSK